MKKRSEYDYFVGESGTLYKRETDYANRRWWYEFKSHHDGFDEWSICDGKPSEKMTPRKESKQF